MYRASHRHSSLLPIAAHRVSLGDLKVEHRRPWFKGRKDGIRTETFPSRSPTMAVQHSGESASFGDTQTPLHCHPCQVPLVGSQLSVGPLFVRDAVFPRLENGVQGSERPASAHFHCFSFCFKRISPDLFRESGSGSVALSLEGGRPQASSCLSSQDQCFGVFRLQTANAKQTSAACSDGTELRVPPAVQAEGS